MLKIISLATIVPALYLSFLVLKEWSPFAWKASRAKQRASSDWILIGVTIAFLSFFVTSLFAGVVLLADFFGLSLSRFIGSHRWAEANGFLRNIPYILASCCHLLAYAQTIHKENNYRTVLLVALALFISTIVLLVLVR